MKILTLSSLYPNENLPGRGSFVENKLKHLRVNSTIEHKVVSPVPHLPVIGQFLPSQKPFETVKKYECRGGFDVYYPKYLHIPGLSMNMGPRNMYKACKPILQRLINEGFDFDLIDSHYVYPDGVAAYYLAQYFNKPFTVTALGTDINILPGFDKPRERIIEALQSADGITAVSKDLCHKMVALGAPENKTKAIYNGVDLEMFSVQNKQKAKHKIGAEGNVLLSIGNLVSLKGFDLIIKALDQIDSAMLFIAGSGPEEANLQKLISDLKLEKRVRLVGRLAQKDLADYYNAADIFILASSHEGMANVLLESIACGTPVIATPIPGMDEVITDEAIGLIMEERSSGAIQKSVTALLSDMPDRAIVRRHAEKFNWNQTSIAQIELFEKIIG